MKVWRLMPFVLLGMLFIPVYLGTAQDATCPALVQRALTAVSQSCSDLGRNTVCYGNTLVEAAFDETAQVTFDQPADRAALDTLRTLRTFPLDEKLGFWGVAVMNVQANLPETLPGQAVKFLLYGDVAIENKGTTAPPAANCSGTATTALNIRSGPGPNYNVLTSLASGATLTVTGQNADSTWLAVTANNLPGWVSADLVKLECPLADLPVRSAEETTAYGPMQAFYFTTSFGEPACKEMPPSALVIQSPKGYNVQLNANGLDLVIGSTVALKAEPNQRLTITTLQGRAIARRENQVQIIPAGFESEFELGGEDGLTVTDDGSEPEPIEIDEDWQAIVDSGDEVFEEDLDVPETDEWNTVDDFCADPTNADLCLIPEEIECEDGSCEALCGNFLCEIGEDANSCPNDCQDFEPECGNLACEVGEDAASCSEDCGDFSLFCGDGVCSPGEDADICPGDCGGFDDQNPGCGNAACEIGEDADTCPADCGGELDNDDSIEPACGNAACEIGEDASSCPGDCGGGGDLNDDSGGGANDNGGWDDGDMNDTGGGGDNGGGGGAVCGNYMCEGGEDSVSCPADCY